MQKVLAAAESTVHPDDDRSSLSGTSSTAAAGDANQSKVERVRQLCDEIQSALPENYVTAYVRSRLQRLGALQPMNAFLRREIDRMQSLITSVSQCVVLLRQFVNGHSSVYYDELMDAFDAVHDARVPRAWAKVDSSITLRAKCNLQYFGGCNCRCNCLFVFYKLI